MPKRKDQDDDSDSDVSLIDVDFEFFDPRPVDYIALKRLMVQLFQTDVEQIDVHEMAELIIAQPLVGTTVKTDGIESDPYAYLTVLNLAVHKDNVAIKTLTQYILKKAAASPSLQSMLQTLFTTQQVAFVFSERLINMPVQVVPPMYRMLSDEMQWAIEENEPYTFSHYIFISRTYRLSAEEENAMEDVQMTSPPTKRSKKKFTPAAKPTVPSVHSFHPEDEQIQKFAAHTLDYEFSNKQPREQDSFGTDVAGRLMLMPADRFPALVRAMAEAYPEPTAKP
ncbi:p21-C-terminal region-binding protein-domain-containing protein [Hysterangium stoloniferum]|nr:p21-C-terminal region-binding protein-domain-containing protein [Hysterangium stoloniferum]